MDTLQSNQSIGQKLIIHGHVTTAFSFTVSCTLTRTSDHTTVSPDIIVMDPNTLTWWASFSNLQAGATYEADATVNPSGFTRTATNLTVDATLLATCGLAANSTMHHDQTLTGSYTTGYGVQCCVYQGAYGATVVGCGSMITFPGGIWSAVNNLPYNRPGCRVLTELLSGGFVLAGSVVDNVSIIQ